MYAKWSYYFLLYSLLRKILILIIIFFHIMIKKYNVGELRRLIKESQNEFKPIAFGRDESKKINDKTYSDIKKETSKYDGGLSSKKREKKNDDSLEKDDNRGMSDLEYSNISKGFKDKVKSQMKGYVSKDAEDKHKNDDYGNADFDDKGERYSSAKKHAERIKSMNDLASEIGLTGREIDKNKIKNLNDTMFESKKIRRLNFKHKFLSEEHMLSRIPDDFKKEGNKFVMRDNVNNEYLVEWHKDEPNVSKKVNMNMVNEERKRIKELWGYKSPDGNKSSSSFRLKEENGFSDMVNKARKLIK